MGNIPIVGSKKTFKWRMEGFSSLEELPPACYLSRPFKFKGYTWKLKLKTKNIDGKSGKECMGLYLKLQDASSLPSDLALNIVFELCVHDQLHYHHRTLRAARYFLNEANIWGFDNVILLNSFKHSTSGFLVNDNFNVSVKFLEARAQEIDCSDMFECLTLQKRPAIHSFTWRIENFTELTRPENSSKNFVVDGHKWNIKLYPDGKKGNNCLSIFLELHTTSALPFNSELYAEFSLSLLDQVNGNHKKFTAKCRFSEESPKSGLDEFLPLEDFQDPLKGFLVENACAIEASVTVLGSSTRP